MRTRTAASTGLGTLTSPTIAATCTGRSAAAPSARTAESGKSSIAISNARSIAPSEHIRRWVRAVIGGGCSCVDASKPEAPGPGWRIDGRSRYNCAAGRCP